MIKYDLSDPDCPTGQILDLISSKWTSLILVSLSEGTKRYSDLQRDIPLVSHKMLTQCLRRLEEKRVIERRVYAEVPPRVEYTLTKMGESLIPPLMSVLTWAETHADDLKPKEMAVSQDIHQEGL